FDGRGSECEAAIESADRTQTTLRVTQSVEPVPEPAVKVTLFQSIPRGDAMERVIQKCVEIGVSEIVPVITRRTVARPRGGQGAKLARWRKIALHAVEQSGRARLVPVAGPVAVETVVERVPSFDLALVPHIGDAAVGAAPTRRNATRSTVIQSEAQRSEESRPRFGGSTPLGEVLGACPKAASVAVAIGPEGGFSPEEIERFAAAGARVVSLGPRVLRSETAGLVAATIVLYHFGEMH
ncbi:MAG: 16S rRNA (uracil(1498)-N(3))-methyltransferase, partial [Armatimonadota bacterium]